MDSLSYTHSMEAASELLRHQTNLLSWLIGIQIIVFIAAAGISIFFNRNLAKKYIDAEIAAASAEIEDSIKQRLSGSLAEETKSLLKDIENKIYKSMMDLQHNVLELEAEQYERTNNYPFALLQWSITLSSTVHRGEGIETRRAIDHMITNAEKITTPVTEYLLNKIDEIFERTTELPDELSKEQNKLEAILRGWQTES